MLKGLDPVATVRYQPLTAEGNPLGDDRRLCALTTRFNHVDCKRSAPAKLP